MKKIVTIIIVIAVIVGAFSSSAREIKSDDMRLSTQKGSINNTVTAIRER